MPRKSGWKQLIEEYPEFNRWYLNLARGSQTTAQERARIINRYLRHHKLTPRQLVENAKQDRRAVENQLLDFVNHMHSLDRSPGYIANYVKAVKSWLQFNDIELVRRINVGNTDRTPSIEDERVPDKDELRQIIGYAKPRGKTSISFMAFSGLRPQVLGDYTGVDGLRISDLPELNIDENHVEFEKIPAMVVVRSELSKAKHRYFTFLGPEGCRNLQAYLEKRIADGEQLAPDSPVISYKSGYGSTGYGDDDSRSNNHITTKTLTKEIRDAMRPKYTWRPYVLRAYFDTQLLIAENNGKLTHSYRQFFMGHKGDIEARYTTNKGRLPEELIEDMRESYRRSLEYLETSRVEVSEDKVQNALRRQLLLVAGLDGNEIDELDLGMSDEEFQEMVRRRLVGSMVNNGNSQRVVPLDDVEEFLGRGWSFVAKLSEEKAVIKID
ncbi:MAG: site-specific integrase [Candidatus Odinarchaeia archaeon]